MHISNGVARKHVTRIGYQNIMLAVNTAMSLYRSYFQSETRRIKRHFKSNSGFVWPDQGMYRQYQNANHTVAAFLDNRYVWMKNK